MHALASAALPLLLLASALVISGCAPRGTTAPSEEPRPIPSPLAGLPEATVEIGGVQLRVAVADTPATRSRGLMEIDDLGPLDGMVFVFEGPSQSGFHMENVPAPLDIAFIGDDLRVLEVLTMSTCPADPCPIHRSPAPFLWAVETPAGGLSSISAGDIFALVDGPT